MIKFILCSICLLFFINIFTFAQPSNDFPIIYRLVDDTFASEGSGYISVINALTQEETNRIPFQTPNSCIELSPDKKRAFLTGFEFTSKGILVADLCSGHLHGWHLNHQKI